jgi:hypothetical protein
MSLPLTIVDGLALGAPHTMHIEDLLEHLGAWVSDPRETADPDASAPSGSSRRRR